VLEGTAKLSGGKHAKQPIFTQRLYIHEINYGVSFEFERI
jgi:hypothetical protein